MAKGGAKVTASDYVKARDSLRRLELAMHAFHQTVDIIVSPVLSKPPAPLGWLNMNSTDLKDYAAKFSQYSGFTAFYNGTGAPSMSVPLHSTSAGLPIGIQMSADWGQDALLLKLVQRRGRAERRSNKRLPKQLKRLPWPSRWFIFLLNKITSAAVASSHRFKGCAPVCAKSMRQSPWRDHASHVYKVNRHKANRNITHCRPHRVAAKLPVCPCVSVNHRIHCTGSIRRYRMGRARPSGQLEKCDRDAFRTPC